jgi:hypothetical protein
MLRERTGVMRSESVKGQPDLGRLRVLRGKCLTQQPELALAALWVYLPKPLAGQRFYRGKQGARAKFFLFVMLLGNFAVAHWPWQQRVANQETGSFIKADDWIGWVIRQAVECQNRLQTCQKRRVDSTDTPGVLQVRLQLVFLEPRQQRYAKRGHTHQLPRPSRPASARSSERDLRVHRYRQVR